MTRILELAAIVLVIGALFVYPLVLNIVDDWRGTVFGFGGILGAYAAGAVIVVLLGGWYLDSRHGARTAICNDGSSSYAKHHQGQCSHHGGVRLFVAPSGAEYAPVTSSGFGDGGFGGSFTP